LENRFAVSHTAHRDSCVGAKNGTKSTARLRAPEESDDTEAAYPVAAFETFLSGRISTFGDNSPPAILTEMCDHVRQLLFLAFT